MYNMDHDMDYDIMSSSSISVWIAYIWSKQINKEKHKKSQNHHTF